MSTALEAHDFEPFRTGPMAGTGVCFACGEQEAQHAPPDPRDELLREAVKYLHAYARNIGGPMALADLMERIEAAISAPTTVTTTENSSHD